MLFARIVLPLHADDDAQLWSPAQRGLQARLFISPALSADYPYGVSIEFRNVLENSSAVGVELKVDYIRDELDFTVSDAGGHAVRASPPQMLEELVRGWRLTLPPWARMSFPIGHGGGTPLRSQGAGKLLSFGGEQQWVLAPSGGPYKLSAIFTCEDIPDGGGLAAGKTIRHTLGGWQVTLALPSIDLPQN